MHLSRVLLTGAVVVALGSATVGVATGVWMSASNVPGFGGEEANVVYSVQQFVSGQPIYTDPSAPPFSITQYSPLYYVVAGTAARCCGIQATDPAGATMVCRIVSLTASLGVALIIFALTRRLRLPVAVGLLVSSFGFVASVPWHFLARPDALMSFFFFLTLYLVLRVDPARPRHNHLWTAAAVLTALLCVATKQNGLQALGLVLLYLLLARAWRELATALLCSAALAGLVVALAAPLGNWLGPAFKENLIDGVRNGLDPIAALERTFVPFFSRFALLIALTAQAAFVLLRRPWCPTRLYLGLAPMLLLAFACATALKAGSATNYWIEFVILAAVASAYWLAGGGPEAANSPAGHHPQVPGLLPLPSLVLASLVFFLPFLALDQFDRCCYVKSLPRTIRPDPRHQFQASEKVVQFLHDELHDSPDTLVLTRECFCIGNQLFPHTAAPQPRIAELSHSLGVVSYQGFRACVAGGKVGYLVTRTGERPAQFLGADFTEFRLLREMDGYAVYKFAPDQRADSQRRP
jgi:hypothetical protein